MVDRIQNNYFHFFVHINGHCSKCKSFAMHFNWPKQSTSEKFIFHKMQQQRHCSFSNGFAYNALYLIPGVNENCNISKWNYKQTNREWVVSMLFSTLDYISWAYYIFNFVQHFTLILFRASFFSLFNSYVLRIHSLILELHSLKCSVNCYKTSA